jgi:hypothetical protein
MTVRTFDWRDFPVLIRYRHRGLFFDNARMLTRGPMLVPAGAMMSYLATAMGIFTYVGSNHRDGEDPILGQVLHEMGSQVARLCFLAPETALESHGLFELLDYMLTQVGQRGGLHFQAEVDERSTGLEMLRQAGFAIYVRQRVWRLTGEPGDKGAESPWRKGKVQDAGAVRALYNNLVPGLVQQLEPPLSGDPRGLVYYQNNELLAYVEFRPGPRGIWVQPFVHPDAGDATDQLVEGLANLPARRSRPIYICVRSYQSWLEHALESLEAEPGPMQAVMVKHLAITQRVTHKIALPALEGGKHEVTTPFARMEK